MNAHAYERAQAAMLGLKVAIYQVLAGAPADGLENVAIGRSLGIYTGHAGHEGHIPRTILGIMEQEGVVEQDPSTKKWRQRSYAAAEPQSAAST